MPSCAEEQPPGAVALQGEKQRVDGVAVAVASGSRATRCQPEQIPPEERVAERRLAVRLPAAVVPAAPSWCRSFSSRGRPVPRDRSPDGLLDKILLDDAAADGAVDAAAGGHRHLESRLAR